MASMKGVMCFLFLVLGITYVQANSCAIPSGTQYRRSVYRPQISSNLYRYPEGKRITHGTKIRIICKRDVNNKTALSKCYEGIWVPALPQCKVEQDCVIPSFARFRRTLYRPQSGPDTVNYPAGSVISRGSTIVAICKKDIYGDMVTARTLSKCKRGRWLPKLPSCKEQKRCRAPPSVQHATASERITPYITFPHGTSVTYTCDVGKMATGSNTTVCKYGKWSDTSFHCKEPVNTIVPSSATQRDTCPQLTIKNGHISVKDTSYNTYDVTCNAGFRLRIAKTYRCRDGNWIGSKPECVRGFKRQKRSEGNCMIPHMRGGEAVYHNAISGVRHAFVADDIVQHGQKVQRECLAGSMLLPVAQFSTTMVTECENGKWNPGFQRCLRDEKDTVFFDNADVTYRIYMKYSGSSTIHVFLDGLDMSGVEMQLHPNVSINKHIDASKFVMTKANMGEITRIRVSTTSQWNDTGTSIDGLEFVAINKEDSGGFYIERFHQHGGSGSTRRGERPCKRQFKRKLNKKPNTDTPHVKIKSLPNIEDATDCQLKCIEEVNCQTVYYSSQYTMCTLYADVPLDDFDNEDVSLFQRTDSCSNE